jgi:hypothetical protein
MNEGLIEVLQRALDVKAHDLNAAVGAGAGGARPTAPVAVSALSLVEVAARSLRVELTAQNEALRQELKAVSDRNSCCCCVRGLCFDLICCLF